MKNIILSSSFYLTNKFINELSSREKIDPENIYFFDFKEKELAQAISEYLSSSILKTQKIVLLKNADFLNKKKLSKNFENFFSSVLTKNNSNYFYLQVDTLKEKNSYYQKISPYFNLIEITPKNKKLNIVFIEKFLKEADIKYQRKSLYELMNYTSNNFEIIMNEINKILLISNNINSEIIKESALDLNGESIFNLLNHIFYKNHQKIEKILDFAQNKALSVITILEILISDLILMIQIKLINGRENAFQSKKLLNVHPFKLRKIEENLSNKKLDNLIYLFNKFTELEILFKKYDPVYKYNILFAKITNLMNNI